ncbi:MAG: DMT family transporter [Pseudomonadota bacterium]
MTPSPGPLLYLKLVAVSVIWGGTFVAGRFLSVDMPPLLVASLRFVLASLALLLFLLAARIPFAVPTARQFLQLLVLGFFGIFFYNLCFFYGLHYVNASRASLIVALNPAVIALVAFLVFKERLSAPRMLGIAFCLVGAGLVIVSRDARVFQAASDAWLGDALILGCVAGWVIYSLFSRNLSKALGPLHTVTYSIWLGTLMLCCATYAQLDIGFDALARISLAQMLSLLYLGVFGSAIAYVWYYDGIRQIGATRSGAFIALNPLTAVLLGALLLGEHLSVPMCGGGVLIVAGLYLCNRSAMGAAVRPIQAVVADPSSRST